MEKHWTVLFHEAFEIEFQELDRDVREELAAMATLLQRFGPELKRPHVDTLNDSIYTNMKKLRFTTKDGVWRVAFAFHPKRRAIMLVAGEKSGKSQKQFYKRLIKKADKRFDDWVHKNIK